MQSLMFLGCFDQKVIEEKRLGGRLDPPPKNMVKEGLHTNLLGRHTEKAV